VSLLGEFSPIGRFFYFWQFFENLRSSLNIWATLFCGKFSAIFLTKTGRATFWVIFSQTHLVTLVDGHKN
jgi:hypothetical protein